MNENPFMHNTVKPHSICILLVFTSVHPLVGIRHLRTINTYFIILINADEKVKRTEMEKNDRFNFALLLFIALFII